MPVTRTEIAGVVSVALARGPRSATEIVSFAVAAGARPAVIDALHTLPARSYSDLRALWPHLADVPVSA
jgi:hypothetical protein